MLVQKVKVTAVGDVVPYPKRENGKIVKDENGNDVIAGYCRQLKFESQDFKKDFIPITLFNDAAQNFNIKKDTEGELQFLCEAHEKQKDGSKRYYPELRMINFIPENKK